MSIARLAGKFEAIHQHAYDDDTSKVDILADFDRMRDIAVDGLRLAETERAEWNIARLSWVVLRNHSEPGFENCKAVLDIYFGITEAPSV